MTYLQMIYEFVKTGMFAVGGGLATIPFLKAIAEKYGAFSVDELTDMIAVSEATPGPIGINMATYAGFAAHGIPGGIIATIALITPSIVTILIISHFLQKFKNNRVVNSVFYALRPASTGLIAGAIFSVLLSSLFTMTDVLFAPKPVAILLFVFFVAATILTESKFPVHPAFLILAGAVCGLLLGDYL